jgi:hypothetical protein
MYVQERDAYTEEYRGAPGVVFWGIWVVWVVVTYLGFTVGETLGQMEERVFAPQILELPRALSIEGYFGAGGSSNLLAALSGGLVAGFVLGIGQGLILFPFLRLAGTIEWVGATTVGMAISWTALYVLSREMSGLVVEKNVGGVLFLIALLVGIGIIVGLALGYPQGIVLRRRTHHSTWWAWATIPGSALVGLLIAVALYAEVENTVRSYGTGIIALVLGASTGIALMELLRHPTTQAEWMKKLRWRREQPATQEDTVLGSAYYRSAGPGSQAPGELSSPTGGEKRGE